MRGRVTGNEALSLAACGADRLMTVLRCTAKLLRRMQYPARPEEPEPHRNPLGEWYADLHVWRRHPFVVLLNADTGAVLVLPGKVADLVRLSQSACTQFEVLCREFALDGPRVEDEVRGFKEGFACCATRDRSLLGSLKERGLEAWMAFEQDDAMMMDVAAAAWNSLFLPSKFGANPPAGPLDYKRPLELVRQCLITPVPPASSTPIRS